LGNAAICEALHSLISPFFIRSINSWNLAATVIAPANLRAMSQSRSFLSATIKTGQDTFKAVHSEKKRKTCVDHHPFTGEQNYSRR
jgi:hypothetical protein